MFRGPAGTPELKDNGKDIFVELSEEALSVKFITPANGTMYKVGETCDVQVAAQGAEALSLFMNDAEVVSTQESTITYSYTPSVAEDIVFKAVATNGGERVEEIVNVTVLGDTQNETRPTDSVGGVTLEGSSATFVLYAPGKQSVVLLSELNDYILPIIEDYPPASTKGKYIRIKYATQLPTPTPQFAFFVNLPQYIKESYRRYLENKIRAQWDFSGVPIQIYFRQK